MAAEAGHAPSRTYRDQDGNFHLNGASFFNDAEADISGSLEVLNDLAPGELGFLDGVVAGTFAASKSMVLDANGDGTMPEGGDFSFGTTTGTKFGTAVSQKQGFWNATPVIQQASADQTAVTDSTGGSVADAIAAAVTAPTAISATLTDSTGYSGTHDDTLAASTVPADYTGGEAVTEAEGNTLLALLRVMAQNDSDNGQKIIELVTAQAADRAAIVALTDGLAKTIELVNSIRSALVTTGLIKGGV